MEFDGKTCPCMILRRELAKLRCARAVRKEEESQISATGFRVGSKLLYENLEESVVYD